MSFKESIDAIADRIKKQRDHANTEEAVKTAFILPFIKALGYDVFNPQEVVPEFIADHGVKKGEKVDYAIKIDGETIILIECKQPGAPLESKHAGQLYRYFAVTDARFAILTDGVRYLFYSDLEKENKMDERPFFEFNLASYSDSDVDELGKFVKTSFDIDSIISTATNLKYMKSLIAEIRSEFTGTPSDEVVRIFAKRVYDGVLTQHAKEQFATLLSRAFSQFIKDSIKSKLDSAFEPESHIDSNNIDIEEGDGIITTEDEIQGYRIIQAIASEVIDPDRVYMRDAKAYCAIMIDDNRLKSVCRFYFGAKKMSISILNTNDDSKVEISTLSEIFKHKKRIIESINVACE